MEKKPIRGVSKKILEILKQHPSGLDIEQIREAGEFQGQQHLDRRLRDLDPFYVIERSRDGRRTVYTLHGEREEGEYDYATISKKLRAQILTRDGRRCRMCGRTVDSDRVKLHVDHKIPREWGGPTTAKNLWSLCSACNEGKRNYFASFDKQLMKDILKFPSVHRRIAELLHQKHGEWVDCDLIEFIANFEDYQTDWRKRLRELRYLNLEIESKRERIGRRTVSYYRLLNWTALPQDVSAAAKDYEKQRAREKRKRNGD